ncbi:MAG: TetR/AcrR family transcriptional regulator [Roseiflexaceae bacterium]
MDFQRARSIDEKNKRLYQIKKAAITLFDTSTYQDITLSKIGEEIDFTRANLYKYVSNKEEIYLYVLIDELNDLVAEMETELVRDMPLSAVDFSRAWATILTRHPRFMKLLSILFTIIEPNATLDALIEFKNNLQHGKQAMYGMIQHNFPSMQHEDILKLLDYAFSFIIARYPMSYPTDKQIEATIRSTSYYEFPAFQETFAELLTLMIGNQTAGD